MTWLILCTLVLYECWMNRFQKYWERWLDCEGGSLEFILAATSLLAVLPLKLILEKQLSVFLRWQYNDFR